MPIIKKPCKYCNKTTDITSEIDLGSSGKLLIFQCGHSYIEESMSAKSEKPSETGELSLLARMEKETENPPWCEKHGRHCITSLESHTGKHPFIYQGTGIVRASKANGKFVFADEMGLGKTIQGLGTIAANPEEMLPAIFLCKSIAKTNWLWETMDWLQIPAQVIYKSSETPFDMFKIHILSLDMINRIEKMFKLSAIKNKYKCEKCGSEKDEDELDGSELCTVESGVQCNKCEVPHIHVHKCNGNMILQPLFSSGLFGGQGKSLKDENKAAWYNILNRCKTIIIDECHLIKNTGTQRSSTIRKLCANIPHILPMSGTLMKNNATEYFVPLNLVKPEKYWRETSFCYNYVRQELVRSAVGVSMKYTGLKDPAAFKEMTKEYMIRRTTDEVMPDLPKLFKQQKYVELDDKFREIYDDSEANFAEWFDTASAVELRTNLLAQLALLRHQTSIAKIDYTIDLALEFLMSNDRKLAIFTHHLDSRDFLVERMDKFFLETGHSRVTVLGRGADVQQEIEDFKNSDSRIIILSTLSHGESINLQFMSDSILHERQWNPANEDQAISGRFRRIGQEAKSISCMIPTALGTIDEYFVELTERKGATGKEIDTGKIESFNTEFTMELAEKIAAKGRAKWKLQ